MPSRPQLNWTGLGDQWNTVKKDVWDSRGSITNAEQLSLSLWGCSTLGRQGQLVRTPWEARSRGEGLEPCQQPARLACWDSERAWKQVLPPWLGLQMMQPGHKCTA